MSRAAPRELPLGFDSVDAALAFIDSFKPAQRLSRLADLVQGTPQANPRFAALGAQLVKQTKRNVSLYRALCQQGAAAGATVDETWCAQQDVRNNEDVLSIEKEMGKAAARADRETQLTELANRLAFASDIGNVSDIHRHAQKQQELSNTPHLMVQSALQVFDALLFAATWDERDTPTSHTVLQAAARADAIATKSILAHKALQRDGPVVCVTEGADFDLFAEARLAHVVANMLHGNFDFAVGLLLSFPLRRDTAQIGKLEQLVQRWALPDQFAAAITLAVLAHAPRSGVVEAINHPELRSLLDAAPQLIPAFDGVINADFAAVGRGIAAAEAIARRDRLARRTTDTLTKLIRRNLVVQFVRPFKVVKLDSIARTFAMTPDQVERLLADLIRKEELGGSRIDLTANLLHAPAQLEADVHQAAIDQANAYVRETHQALRLHSLMQFQMAILPQRKRGMLELGADAAALYGMSADDIDAMMYGGGDDFGFGGGGGGAFRSGYGRPGRHGRRF
jgi:hypothetical protein